MRRGELGATLLVLALGLGAVLLAGARSAAGRMLSLIHISEPTRPY